NQEFVSLFKTKFPNAPDDEFILTNTQKPASCGTIKLTVHELQVVTVVDHHNPSRIDSFSNQQITYEPGNCNNFIHLPMILELRERVLAHAKRDPSGCQ